MPNRLSFVGVLNITPDSFSDGDLYTTTNAALARAEALFAAGAAVVDVGAEATNPRATPLSARQEIERLTPILPPLATRYGADKLSLDTYHPETLEWALQHDIRPIVNDVSGLHHAGMRQLVIDHKFQVIVSHLPATANGIPAKAHTGIPIDRITEVRADLLRTARALEGGGLPRSNIILDPGIGFGKTMRLNWELLDFPGVVPEYAVMIGYSRKRFLHTDSTSGEELSDTIALKQHANQSVAARHAYQGWLTTRHNQALQRVQQAAKHNSHQIYLRVHEIPT